MSALLHRQHNGMLLLNSITKVIYGKNQNNNISTNSSNSMKKKEILWDLQKKIIFSSKSQYWWKKEHIGFSLKKNPNVDIVWDDRLMAEFMGEFGRHFLSFFFSVNKSRSEIVLSHGLLCWTWWI